MNLDSAARQALGYHFIERQGDEKRVAEILEGRLTLPPHAEFSLPDDPTWTENPLNDNNWQFQFHMLRWLDPLRRAALKGHRPAEQAWAQYARSWIESNPPGRSKSRWAWADMADGIRAMELCHGLKIVGQHDWLIASLEQHRQWLADPRHIKRGNHGLHQVVGLFVVSAVLETPETLNLAVSWIGDRIREAWDEEGVNEEGALAYHHLNYNWWQETLQRLDLESVPRPKGSERLDLAPIELAHATTPLGRLSRVGDTNDGGIGGINHPNARYAATRGREGTPPTSNTAIYKKGYAYIRSGWGAERPFTEETFISVLFGAQNKIHGHADGGSLTYCSRGVQWLDDGGRYYYGNDATQAYMTSRASHSSIYIPNRVVSKNVDVEAVSSTRSDSHTDLIIEDPSYDGVRIRRRLIYLQHWDLTLVLDHLKSDDPLDVEQRWHCGRGVTAKTLSFGFSLSSKNKSKHCHVVSLTKGHRMDVRAGQLKPTVGWISTGWRESAPIDTVTVHDSGSNVSFGSLLGEWTPVAVDLVRQKISESGDFFGSLDSIVPAALLAPPRVEIQRTQTGGHNHELSATVEFIGEFALQVAATGPGRYFGCDLYDEGRLVRSIPLSPRGIMGIDISKSKTPKVVIRNQNAPADAQRVVVDFIQDNSGAFSVNRIVNTTSM